MFVTRGIYRTIILGLSSVAFVSMACSKKESAAVFPEIIKDTAKLPIDTTPVAHDSLRKFTWMALGDSYTIGQSVDSTDRFPCQAAKLLIPDSLQVASLRFIATTGWTTANLLSAIATQNPPANYDIVTLLIGVNDQYQGVDTAIYRSRFKQCLQKAVQLAANRPGHVLIVSIPDYSVTSFVPPSDKPRVRMQIDWFNAINKQVAVQNNIAYIDITPSSRLAATDATLIAFDNLHPSAKQYFLWAQLLAPQLKKVLK